MKKFFHPSGQTAIEYLIMLGVLTAIALVAFRSLLPRAVQETNGHFNASMTKIVGPRLDSKVKGPTH